jgi:hypothetical protein
MNSCCILTIISGLKALALLTVLKEPYLAHAFLKNAQSIHIFYLTFHSPMKHNTNVWEDENLHAILQSKH